MGRPISQRRVAIYERVAMFTTAGGVNIPFLERLEQVSSIHEAADLIASWHKDSDEGVPENRYFLAEID